MPTFYDYANAFVACMMILILISKLTEKKIWMKNNETSHHDNLTWSKCITWIIQSRPAKCTETVKHRALRRTCTWPDCQLPMICNEAYIVWLCVMKKWEVVSKQTCICKPKKKLKKRAIGRENRAFGQKKMWIWAKEHELGWKKRTLGWKKCTLG